MTIIVCVDEEMGMAFGSRRVSRDRVLTARILEMTKDAGLFMSPYSAPLFEGAENVTVSEGFTGDAGEGDFCFFETSDPAPFCSEAERIVIYKWNRRYPSDVKFTFSPEENGFCLKNASDFAGHSHENITEEIWERV